jgi:hypothetical protein
MTLLRVFLALIAVLKLLIGGLLILMVLANVNHAFDVAYRPPDWHPVHFVLIVGAIGIAYPHSLIPLPSPPSVLFLLLAAFPLFVAIGEEPAQEQQDLLPWLGVVLAGTAFLLAVGEYVSYRWISRWGKENDLGKNNSKK